MGEIEEIFLNGFCRTLNESRTVMGEYECQPDGSWKLTELDCSHEHCAHHASCLIYKEARDKEKGV